MYISSSTEAPTNIAINTVEFTIHVIPSFSIFFTNFEPFPTRQNTHNLKRRPHCPNCCANGCPGWLNRKCAKFESDLSTASAVYRAICIQCTFSRMIYQIDPFVAIPRWNYDCYFSTASFLAVTDTISESELTTVRENREFIIQLSRYSATKTCPRNNYSRDFK